MIQDFLFHGLTIRTVGEQGRKIMYDLEATPIPTVERENEMTGMWFDEQFVLEPIQHSDFLLGNIDPTTEKTKPSNLILNLLKRV